MALPAKDAIVPEDAPKTLCLEKHIEFIGSYGQGETEYEFVMAEYLRMNGIFWGLTAMDLMNGTERMSKTEIMDFLSDCSHPSGGYSPFPGHDPHLLNTLSAVQIAVTLNSLEMLDVEAIVKYVQGLQQDDGSFAGDQWKEIDTRFSFCAVACLALLGRLDAINIDKAVEFVCTCMNFDGGFGTRPGSESHAGQVYCCLGFLSITKRLHLIDADLLGWWLAERQLPSGGLNGRPEKLPDVCYSWWVLSSLAILGRLHWICSESLSRFILASQDTETGGITDRPGDMPDPFHTLFGVAGLSLLGDRSLKKVNPVFCMAQEVIDRLGIKTQILKL